MLVALGRLTSSRHSPSLSARIQTAPCTVPWQDIWAEPGLSPRQSQRVNPRSSQPGQAAFLLPPGTHHCCAPSAQRGKGSSALRALLNISLDPSPSNLSAFPARRPAHELHTTALRRCHMAPALHRQLLQELSGSISLLSPGSCYRLGFLNLPRTLGPSAALQKCTLFKTNQNKTA